MNTLNSLKKDALEIFYAGLKTVDPDILIRKLFLLEDNSLKIGDRIYNLCNYKNIYVAGFGKASGFMAATLEELLVGRIKTGIVNVRNGYSAPCRIVKVNVAGHPIPDDDSIKGTLEIIQLLKNAGENDLVFCLISGGGSALFELPFNGISLEDIQRITTLLLNSGASIDEVNAIRKHISQVKGGCLANMCKAKIVSLILSDVMNDTVEAIASGPTSPDTSTFRDCRNILLKYDLFRKIPLSIKEHIQHGLDGTIEETPKTTDKIFDRVHNIIIGNNRMALDASCKKAVEMGYNASILSSYIKGEAREAAKVFGAIAKEIHLHGEPVKRPACIIAGGETTVRIRGNGMGGRNQELVLSAAMEIDGLDNTIIISAGTDGIDGNTDAAGALADGTTIMRAKSIKMNPEIYLNDNNSYSFFKKLNDLVVTGPTRTNVMDIMLLLVG
ncbi:MAG: glycerate kinase [Planctomycetes bacterium]|nr:glycerate kinase [Planctomycetota bacterium]